MLNKVFGEVNTWQRGGVFTSSRFFLFLRNYGTAAIASKVAIEDENIAIEVAIGRLNASQGTIAKAKTVLANMGADGIFGRSDIAAITNDSVTAAGNLIAKLRSADLIEPVRGFGKGKYKFKVLKNIESKREGINI